MTYEAFVPGRYKDEDQQKHNIKRLILHKGKPTA